MKIFILTLTLLMIQFSQQVLSNGPTQNIKIMIYRRVLMIVWRTLLSMS